MHERSKALFCEKRLQTLFQPLTGQVLCKPASCLYGYGCEGLLVFVGLLVSRFCFDTPKRARAWQIALRPCLSLGMLAPYAPSEAFVVQYTCSVLFEERVPRQPLMALETLPNLKAFQYEPGFLYDNDWACRWRNLYLYPWSVIGSTD
jgi:hypothetical protein